MIRKFLFLIFLFVCSFSFSLQAFVIDTFDRTVPSSFYSTEVGVGTGGIVTLSYSDSEYVSGTGAMKIYLNIPKVGTWSAWNAVYHYYGKTALQDWSDFGQYFVFDMKAITQSTDARVILNLKDNDEEWQSQRAIVSQWTQYVFEIKKATGANPDYALNTDGFYRPSWISPGNDTINLDTVYGFLLDFTGPHSIEGDFYIDNFKIVNAYEMTIPQAMSIVDKNLTQIKIFLGPKVVESTATNITIDGTTMNSHFDSELNAIICDIPSPLADNTVYNVSIPGTIQIKTTFAMTLPTYSFQFKTGNSMTLDKNSLYRTLQLANGTSLSVPAQASTNNTTFSIEKKESYTGSATFNNKMKFIGFCYQFKPTQASFNSDATIKIFYDENNITDENNLKIYRDTPEGWVAVSSIVNTTANYIEASVNEIGTFAIIQDDYTAELSLGHFDGLSSNPFTPNGDDINDRVKLKYSIYKSGSTVYCKILSTDGVVVNRLVENVPQNQGAYVLEWNGKSENNTILPTGIYLYELRIVDADDLNNSQIYHGAISLIRK